MRKEAAMRKAIRWAAGLAFVAALGWAGRSDWAGQVVYTMPRETYDEIRAKIEAQGKRATDLRVAEYYTEHYNH